MTFFLVFVECGNFYVILLYRPILWPSTYTNLDVLYTYKFQCHSFDAPESRKGGGVGETPRLGNEDTKQFRAKWRVHER